ncbi:hypothetical protein B0H19DRAFT_1187107, partial [Mycena capillaripes]
MGIISVFLYLANIMVLHITTPALFSIPAFNSTRAVSVPTQGLPAWNLSGYSLSDSDVLRDAQIGTTPLVMQEDPCAISRTSTRTQPSDCTKVHCTRCQSQYGIENVTVYATGFNITCSQANEVQAASSGETYVLSM